MQAWIKKFRSAVGARRITRAQAIPGAFRRDGVIFVHVPKAAGSTINLSLFGFRNGHRSIESFWHVDPTFTEEAFKFSFVRHPYLRFVSAYKYLRAGGISTRDAEHQREFPDAFESMRAFAEASKAKSKKSQ